MSKTAHRVLAALLAAGGMLSFLALLPASDYVNRPPDYTTGYVADLVVQALVLVPIGLTLLLLAGYLIVRSTRHNRRRRR